MNILAVFIAAIVSFFVGWIWYSDKLFGKKWRALSGVPEEVHARLSVDKGNMVRVMGLYFVSLVVMAGFLSYWFDYTGILSMEEALKGALCAWIGLVVPATIGSVLWEKRAWSFYFINVLYTLVALLVSSAIIVSWM